MDTLNVVKPAPKRLCLRQISNCSEAVAADPGLVGGLHKLLGDRSTVVHPLHILKAELSFELVEDTAAKGPVCAALHAAREKLAAHFVFWA